MVGQGKGDKETVFELLAGGLLRKEVEKATALSQSSRYADLPALFSVQQNTKMPHLKCARHHCQRSNLFEYEPISRRL
jgi:hypothetical protein